MHDNNTVRKTAIIVAAILGTLTVLYLGGLLGQMNAGYQDWLSRDGISGNTEMPPTKFSPLSAHQTRSVPEASKRRCL